FPCRFIVADTIKSKSLTAEDAETAEKCKVNPDSRCSMAFSFLVGSLLLTDQLKIFNRRGRRDRLRSKIRPMFFYFSSAYSAFAAAKSFGLTPSAYRRSRSARGR